MLRFGFVCVCVFADGKYIKHWFRFWLFRWRQDDCVSSASEKHQRQSVRKWCLFSLLDECHWRHNSNRRLFKPHLLILSLSLSFSFHFHFNFRLNQLNKDQSHQKDFNNIRQTDKKLTQNEVSIEQIEYFFGLNLFRRFFLLSLSENQKERAKYTNKKEK